MTSATHLHLVARPSLVWLLAGSVLRRSWGSALGGAPTAGRRNLCLVLFENKMGEFRAGWALAWTLRTSGLCRGVWGRFVETED